MRTPVILDVNPNPEALDWESEWLERQDVQVVKCGGPHAPGSCPLLRGASCGKVAKADGVLFQLSLDRQDHRDILDRYARTLSVPVRAVVSADDQKRYAELLAEVEVVLSPVGPASLDGFAAEVDSSL